MKAAFQKDEALLADIAGARARGQTRLWWLGQSGFLLHAAGKTILFDPYLSDSLTRNYAQTDKPHVRLTERVVAPERLTGVDVVTSSHNHTDHLDAETLLPLLGANPQARLLIPRANRAFVLERLGTVESRLVEVDAGESVTLAGAGFHGIAAAHNTVERDERGHCRFLGYVVRIGKLTVYQSGDTLLHEGLAPALRAFALDAALLPISGNKPERRVAGNLNGIEVAQLAKDVGARVVVPHHFDMFAFNTEPPDEFERECRRLGQAFRTLRNGEGMEL
ncbi:MAG TPA: MBL fold metallo-hydrolase [Candidatus Binatia bacterium]|jgi:L-ascorbate metabolism protein UlaG (beta-lactamase superfamily)|nr:MBL fold metallo-hydrolase [Candidatus Binatia bacterium]